MAHMHQAFYDVRNELKCIVEDTRRITEDSLSLVSDVEQLEKTCKDHWKELLLDVLCFLCCRNQNIDDNEIRIRGTSTSVEKPITSTISTS